MPNGEAVMVEVKGTPYESKLQRYVQRRECFLEHMSVEMLRR